MNVLDDTQTTVLAFTAAGNNFELALAVAIATFGLTCGLHHHHRAIGRSANVAVIGTCGIAFTGRFSTESSPKMNTPQLHSDLLPAIDTDALSMKTLPHPPSILLLYGSNRDVSYSRLAVLEAERILRFLGADTQIFHPKGLPLPEDGNASHPKVQELHQMLAWAEGMVWCSPERHGAMSSILKAQIDWIPLAAGAIRATQGKALALMQVCGGSQSFNSVNQMRILGRWMRMLTIPNQSSVPKAFTEFDEDGRMKPSAYYDRIVDVMEELVKFTLLTRGQSAYLTDRYSERKESAAELSKRVNQGNL